MEPPTDYQSPHGQHEWEHDFNNYSQHQEYHHNHQAAYYDREQQSSSRGRSSTGRFQNQIAEANSQDTPIATGGGGGGYGNSRPSSNSHSTSRTPRRKGNPQSSSPSLDPSVDRSSQKQQQQHQQQNSPSRSTMSSCSSGPLTPLSTLSTILTTHSLHSQTALQLYRQSHALHRHAADRMSSALKRLSEAQAEVEHATTAQEFAKEELERAAVQKTEANDALSTMCKQVRSLSKGVVNKRVRLIGLNKNVQWNGRLGYIVKLVTDGEDVGRWKVKLDSNWRGRDAGGKVVHGSDSYSEESDGKKEGTDNGASMNVVVAKAENLELVEEFQDENMGVLFGGSDNNPVNGRQQQRSSSSRSRSRSASSSGGRRVLPPAEPQQQHHQPQTTRENSRDPQQDYQSPQRRSRDPSITSRRNDPVEVTPETRGTASRSHKNITPTNYYKSESGRYHETQQSQSRSSNNTHAQQNNVQHHGQYQHHQRNAQHQSQNVSTRQSRQQSPPKQPRHVSPSKQSRQQSPSKRHPNAAPPINKSSHKNNTASSPQKGSSTKQSSSSSKQYSTPIRRSPSNDSARLSSAFSRMLLSPVSFTPVSFHPDPSESFQQWVEDEDNNNNISNDISQQGQQNGNQYQQNRQGSQRIGGGGRQLYNTSPGDVTSVAGSFFDEVTSLERNVFRVEEFDDGNIDEWGNPMKNPNNMVSPGDPQLQQYPSVDESGNNGQNLPNIVILPVPEDDYGNPFLSPGYASNAPPHCVGVQNAGVPHVNGVYLLAYAKDENGEPIVDNDNNNTEGGGEGCNISNNNSTPPLYFKDGPPTLLSDNRYYDMCILRINCPDSADHVIWFLAKVDVDPSCLDVKFSDCYYYCRMLRNDDGCGGEREGGCDFPPSRGWNVPKLPPGVEMLPIAPSGSFSTANTETMSSNGHQQQHQYGLGIHPRHSPGASLMMRSGAENNHGEVGEDQEEEFISPGVDSSKFSGAGSSKFSKYSI